MELKYYQNCPSCGAPIELEEADRLVTCAFCDVKNFMIVRGPLRFILPNNAPPEVSSDELIHIPYLRFKGHIYSCQGKKLEHKILDTTHLGVGLEKMPASLGLRPQAMKIILAGNEQTGRFVKLTEKTTAVFSKAAKLTSAFSDNKEKLYHRSFIGETISLIYLPTYVRDGQLMDGVINRKITSAESIGLQLSTSTPFLKKWMPRYISTLCPNCAEVMDGAHDSLVLACHNCSSLWQEKNGSFIRIPWDILSSDKTDALYVPFWKIHIDAEGIVLDSFADFLRLTNQPVVVRKIHETLDSFFWIPAFKIRPRFFLHIAKNLMVSQIRLPPVHTLNAWDDAKTSLKRNLYPVTMPLAEAEQALKAVLVSSMMNKKKIMPMLPSLVLKSKQAELTYLPFNYIGHDLVQEHTSVSVASAHLRFGRTM